jgi:enterobactin synthetase component D / holo-[acyl-carrier protein] synthase
VPAVIDALMPPTVEAAECFGDLGDGASLFAEELRHMATAVSSRQHEFATTRHCARTALGRLGVAPAPLLPGRRRAPSWPPGVVGSMTHCTGYRAAAVARTGDVLALGIDAEPNRPLPGDRLLERVAAVSERSQLAELRSLRPDVCWDRLLFSAKESVFKAWYPLTGLELRFSDAIVGFDAREAVFTAHLLVPRPAADGHRMVRLCGRWLADADLLLTAVAIEEEGPGPSLRRTGCLASPELVSGSRCSTEPTGRWPRGDGGDQDEAPRGGGGTPACGRDRLGHQRRAPGGAARRGLHRR